mmetsp:Transcript_145741/g.363398  ORF Transcript_145741/g.363398 Transcript_145741/m.363398 type:complete len:207 (-) Transcript_145741:671-1291(-)
MRILTSVLSSHPEPFSGAPEAPTLRTSWGLQAKGGAASEGYGSESDATKALSPLPVLLRCPANNGLPLDLCLPAGIGGGSGEEAGCGGGEASNGEASGGEANGGRTLLPARSGFGLTDGDDSERLRPIAGEPKTNGSTPQSDAFSSPRGPSAAGRAAGAAEAPAPAESAAPAEKVGVRAWPPQWRRGACNGASNLSSSPCRMPRPE